MAESVDSDVSGWESASELLDEGTLLSWESGSVLDGLLQAAIVPSITTPNTIEIHFFIIHLSSKISGNLFHPLGLVDMEGASGIAVAAVQAVRCLDCQMGIMVFCQLISRHRKIVILVDEPHIQTSRARLAVVAVNADAAGLLGRKAAQNGIILFLFGGGKVA